MKAFFVKIHTEIFAKSLKTESLYNGAPTLTTWKEVNARDWKTLKKETLDTSFAQTTTWNRRSVNETLNERKT